MAGALANHKRLMEVAVLQGGYFTSKQAKSVGYDTNGAAYHVKTGNWRREHRGIYSLANYPLPDRPDLILWYLWSQNRQEISQGVYSHQTALSIYDLTDLQPAKLHMTVPTSFRRRSPTPGMLTLHFGDLPSDDIVEIDCYKVTTPLRALEDLLDNQAVHPEIIYAGFREAIERGIITHLKAAQTRNETLKAKIAKASY